MMHNVSFRTKARILLSFTVLGIIGSSQVAAKPVTFAYQTPTLNGVLPLIVGQDFGFFAAEGLEVKTVFI
jgi:ABC-type nitrate/sulfonate/bicarbonate transport system substrate-binding protein